VLIRRVVMVLPEEGTLKSVSYLFAALSVFVFSSQPAYAVCEELLLQLYSKNITFDSASKECRAFVLQNVKNFAYRTTLIEACHKRSNYSGHYRNKIRGIAGKCVDKKSSRWMQKHYNIAAQKDLKVWRYNISLTNGRFCKQSEVVKFLRNSAEILKKTVSDAKSYCY
jgi:hypothetical protein